MRKWWYKRILIMILVFSTTMGTGFGVQRMQDEERKRQVSTNSRDAEFLIPGGVPIGIYMEMDGVLVLATECMECVDGKEYEPAKNLVKSGDYIVGINGEEISSKSELVRAVSKLESSNVILSLRRNEEYIDVRMKSVEVAKDRYKLGIWVKDNMQGLGTLTYVTTTAQYGALGHGIHDSDTEDLIEISDGTLYETNIVGVKKGKSGEPGGLEGVIIYNHFNILGTIEKNTENGIFGSIDNIDKLLDKQEAVAICRKDDIRIGAATIRCTINGQIGEYDIKIRNVDYYTGNVNKGIIIEIVDEELIKLTGGIVQGMSGSPILQDEKIIGAVTHVLVNDPTRGYGIFIEDMLGM